MSYQKVPESYPPPGKPAPSPYLSSFSNPCTDFRFLDLNSPVRDPLLFGSNPSATDRVVRHPSGSRLGMNSPGNAAPDLLSIG